MPRRLAIASEDASARSGRRSAKRPMTACISWRSRRFRSSNWTACGAVEQRQPSSCVEQEIRHPSRRSRTCLRSLTDKEAARSRSVMEASPPKRSTPVCMRSHWNPSAAQPSTAGHGATIRSGSRRGDRRARRGISPLGSRTRKGWTWRHTVNTPLPAGICKPETSVEPGPGSITVLRYG